jgi:myo-inositol-1(or 4)-monophosphatase
MQVAELARRRDVAAAIAREAASRAASLRDTGGGVARMKGAQDFLTEADGATERFIRGRLEEHFPGEAILGEEMGGAVNGGGPLWVLDPIDGTANFARGGDRWCVSVGMVLEGRAVLGVIARHAPAELFAAARGCGATLNGVPIHAAGTTDIARAIIEIGWSARRPFAGYTGMVSRAMALGIGTRCGGSGALGIVEVACGRLDGYLELHINAWDTSAALAIAREAGCWTSDHDSGAWLERGNPIGVAASALAPTVARLLAEAEATREAKGRSS